MGGGKQRSRQCIKFRFTPGSLLSLMLMCNQRWETHTPQSILLGGISSQALARRATRNLWKQLLLGSCPDLRGKPAWANSWLENVSSAPRRQQGKLKRLQSGLGKKTEAADMGRVGVHNLDRSKQQSYKQASPWARSIIHLAQYPLQRYTLIVRLAQYCLLRLAHWGLL